jgi:CheY-like chemotaxis protein
MSDPYSKIRHDLRTPVNQVIGYSELLQEIAEEEGNPHYVADLKKIRAAADRMLELINEFFGGKRGAAAAGPGEAEAPAPEIAAPLGVDAYTPSASPAASPDQEHGRLLVVDDNEMNRDMLSRRLAAKGHSVIVAEDGERALRMIEEDRPDLVLLDVMMPGISGLEVLQRLREKYSVSDMPVIMATAMDASKDIVEALRLGANDYVTKPLDFPVVLAEARQGRDPEAGPGPGAAQSLHPPHLRPLPQQGGRLEPAGIPRGAEARRREPARHDPDVGPARLHVGLRAPRTRAGGAPPQHVPGVHGHHHPEAPGHHRRVHR